MSERVPYGESGEPQEYVSKTSDGRIPCAKCGEWIYTQRRLRDGVPGPAAFPPNCPVCGARVKVVA